jgi:hypothetical protein
MRKLYLTLAAIVVAAAVGVGAVVAFAQGSSPQRTPASKKQAPVNSSAPTAGGTYRPSAPAKPTRSSNPNTAGG